MQFFLGDPQGYKGPEIRYAGGAAGLRADAEAAGIDLYVHAPYIVNVATTNNRIRIPSRKLLQQHMDAAAEIGAKGLIVHGGHVNKDDDPAKGFDNWRKAIEATDLKIPLLIENTAGGDNAMARHLDRIAGVWDAISQAEGAEQVGFCLDTCHAWAGGIELPTAVEKVRAITGRIDLVHANDSRDAFDSGADRHANFGNGQLDARRVRGRRPRRRRAGDLRDPRRRRRAPRRLRVAARARRLTDLAGRALLGRRARRSRRCSPGCGGEADAGGRRCRPAAEADPLRRGPPASSPTCGCPTASPRHGGADARRLLAARYGPDLLTPLANLSPRRLRDLERRVPPHRQRRRLAGPLDRRRAGGRPRSPAADLGRPARRAARPLRRRPPRRLGRLAHRADPGRRPAVARSARSRSPASST